MRLALAGGLEGIIDPDLFASAMPASVQASWEEFERLEPFGTERLYEFLSHAFCRLAVAFHNEEFALGLRSQDFHWWGEAARKAHDPDAKPETEGVSDDQMEWQAKVALRAEEIRKMQAAEKKGK